MKFNCGFCGSDIVKTSTVVTNTTYMHANWSHGYFHNTNCTSCNDSSFICEDCSKKESHICLSCSREEKIEKCLS